MSKIAWAVMIGVILLILLALGASLVLPFWARGLFPGTVRPGILPGLALPFLLMRGFSTFLFWFLIILGVILLFRALARGPEMTSARVATVESPLEILQRRYAQGEISNQWC